VKLQCIDLVTDTQGAYCYGVPGDLCPLLRPRCWSSVPHRSQCPMRRGEPDARSTPGSRLEKRVRPQAREATSSSPWRLPGWGRRSRGRWGFWVPRGRHDPYPCPPSRTTTTTASYVSLFFTCTEARQKEEPVAVNIGCRCSALLVLVGAFGRCTLARRRMVALARRPTPARFKLRGTVESALFCWHEAAVLLQHVEQRVLHVTTELS
jgi:hypothetical protein